ncbi:MAG: single-stranded DNA-binding protein [Alphaproteobacteria bacterium]
MGKSFNQTILMGNLGQDPDVRTTQGGNKVANLRIATNESYTDKDGKRQEKTEWHSVVVWGQGAEYAEKYLKRGSGVLVNGKLQTRQWQDQDGNNRYTTEVVVGIGGSIQGLDAKPDTGAGDPPPHQSGRDYSEDLDDEIPL